MTVAPLLIGLTGSIGMGKSTTAAMFREAGVPVWDADAAVHRLYHAGGAGAAAIARMRPEAVGPEGVNREALKAWITADPAALGLIEAAIHPLVAADRAAFVASAEADIVVLDIPLLFEIGAQDQVDLVLVVTAPEEVQRARVLSRPDMSDAQLAAILARQIPDWEKRRRADLVVETVDMDDTKDKIEALLARLREERKDA